MAPSSLTSTLLGQHESLQASATQHTFLGKAGAGTLPDAALCEWLVQDKHYQFAYVQFMGRLMAKLDLSPYAFPGLEGSPAVAAAAAEAGAGPGTEKAEEKNLEWRTLNALLAAMNAIKAEIDFYNQTANGYELALRPADPNAVTRAYRELFMDSSRDGLPLVCGLTVLWATEYCYLQAWSHAKEHKKSDSTESKGAVAALHKEFIPNWTSPEFKGAVDELAAVADEWAARTKDAVSQCEGFWQRTLDLESKFWPTV